MSQTKIQLTRQVLAVAFLAAVVSGGYTSLTSAGSGTTHSVPATNQPAVAQAEGLSSAFRHAADTILPTVVKIKSTTAAKTVMTTPKSGRQRDQFHGPNPFAGTPFEDFFSNRDGQSFEYFSQPMVPRRDGVGSGVIIDSSGVILTNNHVVEGADTIRVQLEDGREFEAVDVHTDPSTDLAVLRIEGAGSLPAANLGDSDDLRVGDWVLAIGSPFELDETVSAGIVSAKGRSLGTAERVGFLQTDAAINPGNSGGPLVNLRGQVVGINTAIASNNGGYQGIGFAIPVNVAKWVSQQLVTNGRVDRAYLGVAIQPLTPELATSLDLSDTTKGVLIANVYPDTPAANAGLEAGDVVVNFDGKPISTPRDLQDAVEKAGNGSKNSVTIYRDGKKLELEFTARTMPESFGMQSQFSPQSVPQSNSYYSKDLGIRVNELTSEVADQLGYEGVRGVIISSVDPDGIADDEGLRDGMLIQRVGMTKVSNLTEFRQALESVSLTKGILLQVSYQQKTSFIVLKN